MKAPNTPSTTSNMKTHPHSSIRKLFVAATALSVTAVVMFPSDTAAQITRLNGSGTWEQLSLWSPSQVPTAADNVVFGPIDATREVRLSNTNAEMNDLTVAVSTNSAGIWAINPHTSTTNRSFSVAGNATINDWALFYSTATAGLSVNLAGNLNIAADGTSRLRMGGSTSGTPSATLKLNAVTVGGTSTIQSGAIFDLYSVSSTLGDVVNNGQFNVYRAANTGDAQNTNGAVTIGGLSGNGVTRVDSTAGSTARATLTMGSASGTHTYSGVLQNGTTTAELRIVKTGAGTQILTGTNTYSGTTTVSAGALIVNGDMSGATNSFTVASGATLGGSGTIGGATTISGNLTPGNSSGLLTFSNNLTLDSTAVTTMELDGSSSLVRGGTYDAIDVGGTLNYGGKLVLSITGIYATGSTYNFNLFDAGSIAVNSFDVVELGGLWTGSLTNSGGIWTASYLNGSVTNNFTFTESSGALALEVVPEPSTYALLILAAAGLGAHVIRRRRCCCRSKVNIA